MSRYIYSLFWGGLSIYSFWTCDCGSPPKFLAVWNIQREEFLEGVCALISFFSFKNHP